MNEHLLKRFDDELNKLRYRLIRMGTLVQQQVEMALKALLENNVKFAGLVLENEDKIDKLDLKIDKQCLRIFALHQPVAMDLRLVLAAVSMNDNLEFIGDCAADIAENITKINLPPGIIQSTKFGVMSETLVNMMNSLLDSLVNLDYEKAIEVIRKHSEINNYFEANFSALSGMIKNESDFTDSCAYLLDINRNIQIISRQLKSIAEELVFLVEAKIIKHQKIDELLLSSFGDTVEEIIK